MHGDAERAVRAADGRALDARGRANDNGRARNHAAARIVNHTADHASIRDGVRLFDWRVPRIRRRRPQRPGEQGGEGCACHDAGFTAIPQGLPPTEMRFSVFPDAMSTTDTSPDGPFAV